MEEAAEIAQATEFIMTKPEKYQTPIAQGGTNVSGGQKQRLSIARAIAKEPRIYIFDDSFSALDYKTDKVSYRNGANELIQKYKVQLEHYAEALERLTGKKVKEKIIYSFTLNREISVI